ncbi:PorV/PorQ family protein [bacterium]|nr:PorV/PorQ family protein [bacterium]
MNRRNLFFFILLIFQRQVYGEGFSSLKLGGDARASALGMAYTAVSNDGSAGYWNPAGLALLRKQDFIFSIHRWMIDTRGEFVGFGWGGDNTGIGVHILHTEVADFEYRIVPSPDPLFLFSIHELIAGVSYGRIVRNKISIGITFKLLYEKIFTEETIGLGADLGILWQVWEDGLRIGGVLQHVGKTTLLKNEDIPLPVTARFGLALPVRIFQNHSLFVLDGVKERGFPFHLHGGIEFGWWDRLFLRLGYQTEYKIHNITGGMGVIWRQYRLNYSYTPYRSGMGDSHHISIGITI